MKGVFIITQLLIVYLLNLVADVKQTTANLHLHQDEGIAYKI